MLGQGARSEPGCSTNARGSPRRHCEVAAVTSLFGLICSPRPHTGGAVTSPSVHRRFQIDVCLRRRVFFFPVRITQGLAPSESPEVTCPSPPVRSEPTACGAVGRIGQLGITVGGRMFPLDLPSLRRIQHGAPLLSALGMT